MGKKLPMGAFCQKRHEEADNFFIVNNLRSISAFEQVSLLSLYLRAA